MFSSVRIRLTLWYVLAFGLLLICFGLYVLSSLSRDLRLEFDRSLLRTAETTARYFEEFAERKNAAPGARETILELKLAKTSVAIFRGRELLASTDEEVVSMARARDIFAAAKPGLDPILFTESERNRRIAAVSLQVDNVPYTVTVSESLLELSAELRRMREMILFAIPAVLALAAFGGFMLAGKSLKPVITISAQAEHITAKNLNERLEIRTHDEFGRLAGVFNALLSRLDDSFRVMREFMADASHELRTPLAIIHGEAEVSLSRERSASEYRESLGIVRDNSKRMALIVKDMLDLARADSGQHKLYKQELYLDDLVVACCRNAQALAVLEGVELSCSAEPDVSFEGDEELLKRMTMNLLDNAIRYTPSGGSVSVKLSRNNGTGYLTISDSGIGIPPACVDRVFDRFYRVAESRTRANGGSGLGLSIVKLAAESHGGSVSVVSAPGQGSTFQVCLPLGCENNN